MFAYYISILYIIKSKVNKKEIKETNRMKRNRMWKRNREETGEKERKKKKKENLGFKAQSLIW